MNISMVRISQSVIALEAFLALFLVIISTALCAENSKKGGEEKVLNIGSRLELFVDDWLIDKIDNLCLQLHSPIPREIAIRFNEPWEGEWSAYVTVMKDDNLYRMYYRGARKKGEQVTCYAESKDGITWTKPSLGICEYKGSKNNNIIWTGTGTHNFAPFKDTNPAATEAQRYKAVAGGPLIALASPDGIHWKKIQEKPIITDGAFDSLNIAFWDSVQGRYACYLRDFRNGVRTIRRATSQDFINWTKPEWLDFGDTPPQHLYTNATIPYFRAPHIYLAFPKRFVPSRKAIKEHPEPGVSDGVFMSSRDGLHWDRRFLEAFIRPGLDPDNWTERSNMPAWGILPTAPGEISIYWSEHYSHPTCRMRRGTIRTDGFVSVHATYAGGEFVTKPLTFQGKELVINYSTSAVGSVRVEMQDANGKPIANYLLNESDEIYGDELERVVSWKKGSDVSDLAGTPVRLRFAMKDADLYSIRFRP